MSFEIRCKCGWRSQVSEFYLGDRITCPECACKVEVRENADVPYAYPPYPTWQKRVPAVWTARRPVRRRVDWRPKNDPNANPAFWMGAVGLFFTFVGCGILPGVLMAIFAIRAGVDSRRFCNRHGILQPSRARAGLWMGVGSIVLALLMAFGFVCNSLGPCQAGSNHKSDYCVQKIDYKLNDRNNTRPAPEQSGEELPEYYRFGCDGAVPRATPVEPKTEFQHYQHRYSERIRRARESRTETSELAGDRSSE